MPLPLPDPGERWSLFLDFDGTLTELAETPDAVRVDPRLPGTLVELQAGLMGAVALVSGRRLADLDRHLAPARLAAAGLHGLELRRPDGTVRRQGPLDGAMAGLRRRLERLAAADPRLLVEDKELALALHFRAAPERERECRDAVEKAVAGHPDLHVLHGKLVAEIKPVSATKRHAIESFMGLAPFRGGLPVFAGDDRTDEDGFEAVQALGGIAVKVGDGPTRATLRTPAVPDLLDWLHELPAHLAGGRGPEG